MISDNMSVMARRAPNQNRPLVISMLGHAVRRTFSARFAGKGDLVCGLLFAAQAVLFFMLGVGLCVELAVGEGRLAG